MGCTYLYFSCGVWNYSGAGGGRGSGGGGDFDMVFQEFLCLLRVLVIFFFGYLLIAPVESLSFFLLSVGAGIRGQKVCFCQLRCESYRVIFCVVYYGTARPSPSPVKWFVWQVALFFLNKLPGYYGSAHM